MKPNPQSSDMPRTLSRTDRLVFRVGHPVIEVGRRAVGGVDNTDSSSSSSLLDVPDSREESWSCSFILLSHLVDCLSILDS